MMVTNKFRDYILDKFFFPKTVVIDKPGIIISKNINHFTRKESKIRIFYTFEEFYVSLYKDTLKKIGKERTDKLWYIVGKDVGTRYFLFKDNSKIPLGLVKIVLEKIQTIFNGLGMGGFENLEKDFEKGEFIFSGKNNIICRKIGYSPLMAGIASGVMSFILGKNIESKYACVSCPHGCKIILNFKFDEIYIPNFSFLKPSKEYSRNFNFSKPILGKNFSSFSDFLKFGFIKIDEKRKFYFREKTIIPSEIGLPELFSVNYEKIGESKLFMDSSIVFFENLFKSLFDSLRNQEKVKNFLNISSAFGYGRIFFNKKENEILVNLLDFPFTKFNNNFLACHINGFLNYFYNKKFFFVGENKGIFRYTF